MLYSRKWATRTIPPQNVPFISNRRLRIRFRLRSRLYKPTSHCLDVTNTHTNAIVALNHTRYTPMNTCLVARERRHTDGVWFLAN